MATSSFGRGLIIKDDKAAKALVSLIDNAEKQKPIRRIDVVKKLESGDRLLEKSYSP